MSHCIDMDMRQMRAFITLKVLCTSKEKKSSRNTGEFIFANYVQSRTHKRWVSGLVK